MSNNREKRIYQENVHLYLAIMREGTAKDKKCIRTVIKNDEVDLQMLEAKIKVLGGIWRIYKTVNSRNCEVARKILMKTLIDHPEKASVIASEWRTALMQEECKSTKYFMFDVDTKNYPDIIKFEMLLGDKNIAYIKRIESPKGWHYITEQFDTREICKLEYVTLLRDGYYFVKIVGEK